MYVIAKHPIDCTNSDNSFSMFAINCQNKICVKANKKKDRYTYSRNRKYDVYVYEIRRVT